MPQQVPTSGKRLCGICNKPLNTHNKNDFCLSHSTADKLAYQSRQEASSARSREFFSFVKQFHQEGAVEDMFAKAAVAAPKLNTAITEIPQYPEALGLLKAASMVFRLPMPVLLRARVTAPKQKTEDYIETPASRRTELKNIRHKAARDVMMYLMKYDLHMEVGQISDFFGFKYPPNVAVSIQKISDALIDDEDIILAVDLMRRDYQRMSQED
jgi:hypothetical protein